MPNKKRRKTVIVIALLGVALAVGLVVANWDAVVGHVPLLGGPVDRDLVNANNQFAFDLYAQLAKDNRNDNIFFSPLSLSTILAQTYAGARGNTAKEMKEALHFDLEPAKLHAAMGTLLRRLEQGGRKGGNQLDIANALWVEQTYSLLPDFVAIGNDHYRAAPRSVDFKHAAEAQRKTINDWVEDHTHGKITDLMPPGSLNADSSLVLTNAVYFKGAWKAKFNRAITRDAPFVQIDGSSVKTPMMQQTDEFLYMQQPQRSQVPDLQVLEMPYISERIAMLVLLPGKLDGLAELEKSVNAEALDGWIKKLHKRHVDVVLPRFTVAVSYRLGSSLQALGLQDAFSAKAADFSGMSTAGPLFMDAVMHKAFVDVNEEGTEAAAATGDYILPVSRVSGADHPFIFLIRDMHSGSILFLGRVMNPMAM